MHNLFKKITDKPKRLKATEFNSYRNTDIARMLNSRISSPSGSNGNNHIVKHKLYITIANISKFSGETKQTDVDTFINRVDTHIANRGVTEDHLKIETSTRDTKLHSV